MYGDTRRSVHALVDQLPPPQLSAMETILRSMIAPLSREFAAAPIDDEPYTEEDRRAVAEAEEWLRHNDPIPNEQVLAKFGLTTADWDARAAEPLPEATHRG